MNISISSQKLDLIHWISELNDISILEKLNAVKKNTTAVSNTELLSIERGFDDFQQGRVVSHTQAKKRYEKWL
jgi:hypothetical protein